MTSFRGICKKNTSYTYFICVCVYGKNRIYYSGYLYGKGRKLPTDKSIEESQLDLSIFLNRGLSGVDSTNGNIRHMIIHGTSGYLSDTLE